MVILLIAFSMLVLVMSACSTPDSTVETLPTDKPESPESGATSNPTRQPTSIPTPSFKIEGTRTSPLRVSAQQRNFQIGAAVAYESLIDDPLYGEILAREFNMITAENVMKFESIHPVQETYSFEKADTLVAFAEKNTMQVRGHTLVWHNQLPDWLTDQTWTREDLLEILHDHITTVVSHYKGKVAAWDVINEAVTDNGTMRNSIWYKVIGPEYIDLAFQWAHEADPEALLFYNDYNAEGVGKKSTAVYDLVKDLVARGIPIHGVGLQFHVDIHSYPQPSELELNIERLAELGLVVHITEMDVRFREPADETKLVTQANIYHDITQVCLQEDACQALVLWGFTDKYSWIPYVNKGFGSALPFDDAYEPKPAYAGMVAAFAEE
jgi:endo-1,4-beta-xylanase